MPSNETLHLKATLQLLKIDLKTAELERNNDKIGKLKDKIKKVEMKLAPFKSQPKITSPEHSH